MGQTHISLSDVPARTLGRTICILAALDIETAIARHPDGRRVRGVVCSKFGFHQSGLTRFLKTGRGLGMEHIFEICAELGINLHAITLQALRQHKAARRSR